MRSRKIAWFPLMLSFSFGKKKEKNKKPSVLHSFQLSNSFYLLWSCIAFFSLSFARWKEGKDDNVTTAGCRTLDFILTTASHKKRKKEKGRRKKKILRSCRGCRPSSFCYSFPFYRMYTSILSLACSEKAIGSLLLIDGILLLELSKLLMDDTLFFFYNSTDTRAR